MRIHTTLRLLTLGLAIGIWPAVAVAADVPDAKTEAKPESKPEAKPEAKPVESEAEKLFNQGRELLFQGKYDEAIDLLS